MTPAERFWQKIAWQAPRELVRWCFVRVVAHATTGQFEHQIVPELTAMDALGRWDEPNDPLPRCPINVDMVKPPRRGSR